MFNLDLAGLDFLIGEIRCIPERPESEECIFKVTVGRCIRSVTFEKFVEFLIVACKRFNVDIRNADLETMFYGQGLVEVFEERVDEDGEMDEKEKERQD